MNPASSLDTSSDTIPHMIDLLTTGLCRSRRSHAPSQQAAEDDANDSLARKMPSLRKSLNFLAVTSLVAYFGHMRKEVSRPIGLAAKAHAYFENSNTIFDQTVNNWQPMAFADNQEQNENYTFNNMLMQDYIEDFLLSMKN